MLKSDIASLDSRQQVGQNEIEARFDSFYQQISQNYSATELRFHMLDQQFGQNISAVEDLFSQQFSEDRSEFYNQIQQLNLSTQLLHSMLNSAPSCAALPPSSPSGYYWVRASVGFAVRVCCDMTRSCGGVTGGWVRVAELDMTNSSHQCPSGLRQLNITRCTCVKIEEQSGCSSPHNFIINYNIQY